MSQGKQPVKADPLGKYLLHPIKDENMESNRSKQKGGTLHHLPSQWRTPTANRPMRFPPGTLTVSPAVMARILPEDASQGLFRHLSGDWGDVGKEGWKCNEEALKEGKRLLSFYTDRHGTRYLIVTESDRSHTVILLPEEI